MDDSLNLPQGSPLSLMSIFNEWARTDQMEDNEINKLRQSILDEENNRKAIEHCLNGEQMKDVGISRHLYVIVYQSLKVNIQVKPAIREPNDILAFIASGFEYESGDILLQLQRAFERPDPS